ncbi:MAG TPA: undecaprenyl-diphosphate phosphatase [Candidatus Eremiobacteraceae bacterium]
MINAIIHAVMLGIIQGIAELFPVSSVAHTVLLSYLFHWGFPSLPFVVMLHLGTFLAVLVYFWKDFATITAGFFSGFRTKWIEPDQRLGLLVVVGFIPLALAGKALSTIIDPLFAMPVVAAGCLLLTGVVLFITEMLQRRAPDEVIARPATASDGTEERMWFPDPVKPKYEYTGAASLSIFKAIGIGLSQVAGLIPGGSRSGFSICAGMFAGLSREESSRYSFLLAGPAILGASLFELPRVLGHKSATDQGATMHGIANLAAAPEPLVVIAIGTIVAFVSGLIAIRFFMKYVSDHKLTPFAVYCWAFGLFMLGVIGVRHGA